MKRDGLEEARLMYGGRAMHGEYPPAISRRQRIERKSVLERTADETVYLETFDLLEAYSAAELSILDALRDYKAQVRRRSGA